MGRRHIAFCLDQAYGHIYPTLGIASELIRRGHNVSYAVPDSFADAIQRNGARPMKFEPVVYRSELYPLAKKKDGSYDFSKENVDFVRNCAGIIQKKTENSLAQLESLYEKERPDLIIHDDAFDLSGRELAKKWNIRKIRHFPAVIYEKYLSSFRNDELILVSVPEFFNGGSSLFDDRFRFIGFIPENIKQRRWANPWKSENVVLVSPTTGLLPQIEFCRLAISAFQDLCFKVVLSAVGRFDPVSDVDTKMLAELPTNVLLNDSSPHLEILQHACLYVGQGGPRSILEALYCGVPSILIPPSQAHEDAARRVSDLGLGITMAFNDASPESIGKAARFLVEDKATQDRLRQVRKSMHANDGASLAADLIERYMAGETVRQ